MNQLTQKRNEKFKTATKSERAVMVAKDALSMLGKGKIAASVGRWAELPISIFDGVEPEDEENIQICDLTDSESFNGCKTCALGALMLSEIRHTNKLALSDVCSSIEYDQHGHRLNKVFSLAQQKMMEYAFEGGSGYFYSDDIPSNQISKLDDFYEKYPGKTDRLRAILKNVIKNNGKFVV